jgi:hypothetical protein
LKGRGNPCGSRRIASSLALLAMTAQFLDLANLEITPRRHVTPSAKSAKSADKDRACPDQYACVPIAFMPPSDFLTPAKRFAGIVNGLFHAIAVRRDAGFLAQPVAMLLWARLAHLRALATRLADGKGSGVPRRPATPSDTKRKPRRPAQRLEHRSLKLTRL